jgi:hypothetical protein
MLKIKERKMNEEREAEREGIKRKKESENLTHTI